MEIKIKNKNKSINKISFIIALFFALAQLSQANVVLGASISAGEMVNLTNESRAGAGLPLLLVNEKLTEAAREKADDMFEFQYFDHNSPSGITPWDFIKSAGYDYRYAGENLAIDFVTANGAHKALMESSSHRKNILNSNYTEIGVAAAEGMFDGNKSIIIVEEFGTPLEKEIIADYNLNENVKLIIEEKADEINNLKDNDEKERELEEFPQTGSTQEYGANIEQEYGANGLKEESVNEQDDNLSLSDLNTNYEILKSKFRETEWSDKRSDSGVCYESETCNKVPQLFKTMEPAEEFQNKTLNGKFTSAKPNLDEEKNKEAIIEYNPILLAGNLNNEKVMGLVNKAYAKDEHIRKYDYRQNSAGLAVNRYFQNEFIENVLLLYAILSVMLISNFMVTAYSYYAMRN